MRLKVALAASGGSDAPLQLAYRELADYLPRACPGLKVVRSGRPEAADLVVGCSGQVAEAVTLPGRPDPDRDEVWIESRAGQLLLAGSNGRSALYAVYTWLHHLGFAWPLPFDAADVIPALTEIPLHDWSLRVKATQQFRGLAPAGSYSPGIIVDLVRWMARNRFNYLFIEGFSAQGSYHKAAGKELSAASLARAEANLERAVQERGMLLERMGHHWTAMTLGFGPDSKRSPEEGIPAERVAWTAMTDGRRDLWRGSPGNTHICLSNAAARQEMCRLVVEYAREHRAINVLGVWMADGTNNWCECAACRKVHPSDLWVRTVNELSEAVHQVRPDLKIEVLSYVNLMEPPPSRRLNNRHRNIILMYAPFLRCYLHRLDDAQCRFKIPLQRFPPANKLHFPANDDYFAFFKAWREGFDGPNYIFDYYHWLPVKRDIFEGNVPQTIYDDLRSYPDHGIMGVVDCSRARAYWPTPLGRLLQARAAWDDVEDYSAARQKVLAQVYGAAAAMVGRYLDVTYECLLPATHCREEEWRVEPARLERYRRALPGLRRALTAAREQATGIQHLLLHRVLIHLEFTALHVRSLVAESQGRYGEAAKMARAWHEQATRHQKELEAAVDFPELDWLLVDTLARLDEKAQGIYQRPRELEH